MSPRDPIDAQLEIQILHAVALRAVSLDELWQQGLVRAACRENRGALAMALDALQQRKLIARRSHRWCLSERGRDHLKQEKRKSAIRSTSSPTLNGVDRSTTSTPPAAAAPNSGESISSMAGRTPQRTHTSTEHRTRADGPIPSTMVQGATQTPNTPMAEPVAHACRWGEPWREFHRLLSYYIRCVEEDERPGINCIHADLGKTWLPFPDLLEWSYAGGAPHSLPLQNWMSDFLHLAADPAEPVEFYYGYPVEAFTWISKEDASLNTFLTPALLQPMTIRAEAGRLRMEMRDRPRLNERWLEGHFYAGGKEAVVGSLRALNTHGPRALACMVGALTPFLRPNKVLQSPEPRALRSLPARFDQQPNGIPLRGIP